MSEQVLTITSKGDKDNQCRLLYLNIKLESFINIATILPRLY